MPFKVTSILAGRDADPADHETPEAAIRDGIRRFGNGHERVRVTGPEGDSYPYHEFPTLMQKYAPYASEPAKSD
jgi:hypothetical protein